MMYYELLFILPGTLAESEVEPFVKKVESTLVENGAENITINDMGKNRLAYPIQHIRYGYFKLCHFQAMPESVNEIQKKFRLVPELLRSFIKSHNPELKKEANKRKSRVYKPNNEVETETFSAIPITLSENKESFKKEVAGKVSLEEIDKQLDEILEGGISEV